MLAGCEESIASRTADLLGIAAFRAFEMGRAALGILAPRASRSMKGGWWRWLQSNAGIVQESVKVGVMGEVSSQLGENHLAQHNRPRLIRLGQQLF